VLLAVLVVVEVAAVRPLEKPPEPGQQVKETLVELDLAHLLMEVLVAAVLVQ
jgi:hypothetical protein